MHRRGYFAGKFVKIHLQTGVVKWEREIPNVNMHYNEEQGIFISFWAGNNNGKNYQIIHIDEETIDVGEPRTDYEFDNVNTLLQNQYLEGDKLYFADNVQSYGDKTVPIKFGRFDIKTKEIDFMQEIPIEHGIQVAQMIYNEDKLYIRMTENNLLVYEDN